ncbi:DUF2147 domain-containing protein [Sphingomonas sp. TDK1]|uniref:DUF2147 domain-containing protein n=1 Tax=Sphingomonas sp. TDK1 TaxID=453247 RepID=UPI0007D9A26E|nr:DUF2147 domain-containing protein [Sphingomonas sp. TDK1]OAN58135.1 hypothetical protein A7X12_06385 [Sphingomonas sp. TDK1]
MPPLSLFLVAAIALGAPADQPEPSVWRNPSNSVHVRAAPCGTNGMCATVIWASEKAKADARRGGTEQLVGTQLFQNFKIVREGLWKGTVFVPDIHQRFSGTVTVIDENTIVGKGCALLGAVCKSQTWTRVRP